MAKAKKITKDELQIINETSTKFNEILIQLGSLNLAQQDLTMEAAKFRSEIEKVKLNLQEKYGNVNVDLKDGTYTETENVKDKKD
jgi:hypothetical protein|tara:strand:+ start:385 stop:639 length:255 start_codon:yes stop_codon:yes gene_type:complete